MDLLDAPRTLFFSKLIQRDYSLLQGSRAARLRAIATLDQVPRRRRRVAWLRSNYEKPLRVEHWHDLQA